MSRIKIDTEPIMNLLDGDLLVKGNHSIRAIFSRIINKIDDLKIISEIKLDLNKNAFTSLYSVSDINKLSSDFIELRDEFLKLIDEVEGNINDILSIESRNYNLSSVVPTSNLSSNKQEEEKSKIEVFGDFWYKIFIEPLKKNLENLLGAIVDSLKNAMKNDKLTVRDYENIIKQMITAQIEIKEDELRQLTVEGATSAEITVVKIQLEDLKNTLDSEKEINKLAMNCYYTGLLSNEDFSSESENNLTEKEKEAVSYLLAAFPDQELKFFDRDFEIVREECIKHLGTQNEKINWRLIKSAYEKGNIINFINNDYTLSQGNLYMLDELDSSIKSNAYYTQMFTYMTEEERNIASYLCNTKGILSVNKYLDFKQEEINARKGWILAEEFLLNLNFSNETEFMDAVDSIISEGLSDGATNFVNGINNTMGGVDGVISAQDYKVMYIAALLGEEDLSNFPNLSEEGKTIITKLRKMLSDDIRTGMYEISSAVGNMMPAIFVSTAISLATTPAVGANVGRTLMAVSSAGNAAESLYQQGYEYTQSIIYGLLCGASEGFLGQFGGIPGLSKLSQLKGISGFLVNILKEGGEEATQELLQSVFKSLATGEKISIDIETIEKAGIYGMIIAGMMNGGSIVINGVSIIVNNLSNETIEIIRVAEKNGYPVDYTKVMNPEYINFLKNNSVKSLSHNNFKYNTVEENILEIIQRQTIEYVPGDAMKKLRLFIDPNSEYYGDYSIISNSNLARDILSMYTVDQIRIGLNNLSNNNLPSLFGNSSTNDYGVDQGGIEYLCRYKYNGPTYTIQIEGKKYTLHNGEEYTYRLSTMIYNEAKKQGKVLPEFTKTAYSQEYVYLKDKLISQGFSNRDASVIMSSLNDAGACSYAATANEIFVAFIGKETEFEQKFGYPMYKIENGCKVLNSNELLLDLYIYCNHTVNGGKFILGNNTLNPYFISSERTDITGNALLVAEEQEYMSGLYSGKNTTAISKFLNSKGVNYNSKCLFSNKTGDNVSDSDFAEMLIDINSQINSGKSVSMDIYQIRDKNGKIACGNTINMISTNLSVYNSTSTATWSEGGGHSVFITGIGSGYFYVSSWGQEYAIPFKDLQNGGLFNVYCADIN
ncbi:MAG: hypothetical protein IJY25_01030 [Bacilli bacterium]|nr:hypothetical protein [Bacilli bacterium]